MVLSVQQVRDIVTSFRSRGSDVGLRDVSFAVLALVFDDDALAFRAMFGDSPAGQQEEYLSQPKIAEVKDAIRAEQPEDTPSSAISFDDLKEGLIEDMRSLERLRDTLGDDGRPTLEPKEMATVVARIADIRVKLTEKFNTTERVVEQRVVVEQKYNAICACGREIYLPEGARISETPNQRDLFDTPSKH